MDEARLRALVREDAVHRDLYVDPAVFALEMRRLWRRSWLFVGHDSQVPSPGDFATLDLGNQPVLMVRREDGAISVLHNRCAHKGAPLATAAAGHAGERLRCPYHGWTYRLDGHLASVPLREAYADSAFRDCPASGGLSPWGEVAVHRGFVFARAEAGGPGFGESLGELLPALDRMADRSPTGRLQVAGGVLRTAVRANWKIYLENVNDALHPVTTHASASLSARTVWESAARTGEPPLALRQLLPFGSGHAFYEAMGGRVLPGGHSVLGTRTSLHDGGSGHDGYDAALEAAHGPERARQALGFVPQNVVFYPAMALKASPAVMRVLRPRGPDRTVVEAWAFQPEGAPDSLLEAALAYNRQVFSPLSMVAHDDLHLFERTQLGLAGEGNPWVSLHRGSRPAGDAPPPRDVGGTDEALLRNQYRAWVALMAPAEAG